MQQDRPRYPTGFVSEDAERPVERVERPMDLRHVLREISPIGEADAPVESQRGRPLLHLHLTDRPAGLARLLDAARSLAEEV